MKSYVNFCARVSWDPCILATCVCRSLGPGSAARGEKAKNGVKEEKYRGVQRAERTTSSFASLADVFFRPHQFFLLFTMRSPVPGLSQSQATQAMSVDISSPVFTLTKW